MACSRPPDPAEVAGTIGASAISQHTQKLSTDEMEGRAPGSKGEELATAYIADFYRSLGLKTSFQAVPLVGIDGVPSDLTLTRGGQKRVLRPGTQFVAFTQQEVESIGIDGELVFVGYGVTAPEYQWNDFKDVDVKGKIIVLFVNDPPLADPKMFGGKAMTYYGRWTYKYEEAARQGAAGALIVHETGPAGYPWEVVQGGWSGERFDIVKADKGVSDIKVGGWIQREVADQIFIWAGHRFDDLKQKALQPDFKPIPLGIRASVDVKNKLRHTDSKNVIGVLEGQTPEEYVIFTSHWDHLGIGLEQSGDKIYNGAIDNASGTAMMMEIARAFASVQPRPKRSIVFLAVTAEEQGLLGSKYYAENPVLPLNKTLANINMDSANVYGRNDRIGVVGYGYSSLEDILREIAAQQGRTVVPEEEPEKGYYYRSDQFSFAKQGVPALYLHTMKKEDDAKYTAERYHKPSDEFDPNWNLEGAVLDTRAYFLVGLRVANDDKWPEWKPGTEFKAIREKMLK